MKIVCFHSRIYAVSDLTNYFVCRLCLNWVGGGGGCCFEKVLKTTTFLANIDFTDKPRLSNIFRKEFSIKTVCSREFFSVCCYFELCCCPNSQLETFLFCFVYVCCCVWGDVRSRHTANPSYFSLETAAFENHFQLFSQFHSMSVLFLGAHQQPVERFHAYDGTTTQSRLVQIHTYRPEHRSFDFVCSSDESKGTHNLHIMYTIHSFVGWSRVNLVREVCYVFRIAAWTRARVGGSGRGEDHFLLSSLNRIDWWGRTGVNASNAKLILEFGNRFLLEMVSENGFWFDVHSSLPKYLFGFSCFSRCYTHARDVPKAPQLNVFFFCHIFLFNGSSQNISTARQLA